MQLQQPAPAMRRSQAAPARMGRLSTVSTVRAQATAVMTTTETTTKSLTRAEVEDMARKMEMRAKAMIALEEAQVANRTKVKVSLQKKLPLGSAFKITGSVPELGSFLPEVAPYMKWNNGDVWTWEGPIRPGKMTFKIVVRHPDGTRFYEDGEDRLIEVPADGPDALMEVKIDAGKLSWPYMS